MINFIYKFNHAAKIIKLERNGGSLILTHNFQFEAVSDDVGLFILQENSVELMEQNVELVKENFNLRNR